VAVEVTATLGHRSWYANEMVAARDAYFDWAEKASASAMVKAVESGMTAGDVRARTLATNSVHRLARASSGRWQVKLYLRALASDDEGLRRAAASALAAFDRREAAELLLVRAREGSPAEASSMIDALAKLGDARVVDVALSRAAEVFAGAPIPDRPEPAWLCNSAVCALGGFLGDARAFEALSRSLKHDEMRMRRDAATVLGKAGEERAVPLLQPVLQDPNKQVRNAARTALAALAS
jgi:HEAT repeat protein